MDIDNKAHVLKCAEIVFRAYLARGYYKPTGEDAAVQAYLDEQRRLGADVLVVEQDGEPVGTIMVSRVRPDSHFHLDEDFPAEMGDLRARYTQDGQCRLGYFGKLAVWPVSEDVIIMIKLLYQALKWALEAEIELVLLTINPRHQEFYTKVLQAEEKARCATDAPGLSGAPSVFVALDLRSNVIQTRLEQILGLAQHPKGFGMKR